MPELHHAPVVISTVCSTSLSNKLYEHADQIFSQLICRWCLPPPHLPNFRAIWRSLCPPIHEVLILLSVFDHLTAAHYLIIFKVPMSLSEWFKPFEETRTRFSFVDTRCCKQFLCFYNCASKFETKHNHFNTCTVHSLLFVSQPTKAQL